MKTIKVSQEVWNEIAKRGNFGETEDDVLRRVFELETTTRKNLEIAEIGTWLPQRIRLAVHKLSAKVENGQLYVNFAEGPCREFSLPSKEDKDSLRKVTYEAMDFAQKNGATHGQVLAVRKALTNTGYHLTK